MTINKIMQYSATLVLCEVKKQAFTQLPAIDNYSKFFYFLAASMWCSAAHISTLLLLLDHYSWYLKYQLALKVSIGI
jgi:hypothetical protein